MINFLRFVLVSLFLTSCSFNDRSGFWTNEKRLQKERSEFKILFEEKEKKIGEFNKEFIIKLNKSLIKPNKLSKFNNDDGFSLFDGNLQRISKYSFSKIRNYELFEPNLILDNENIIFFDNQGTILKFNENSKKKWETNNYTKDEKKASPILSMFLDKNKLIVADNLSKIYAVNIDNGEILWSKKQKTPSNSQVKVYKDKFFVIDSRNNLNCFSVINGEKVWSHSTEKSFINSSKKLSMIIKSKIIVFNNSLGDITGVDVDSGKLLWQVSTQQTDDIKDLMSLKTSILIENDNSIYFVNNKNQFFSIELNTGAVNWIQNINSDLKPTIINELIFSISKDGYLYTIEKKTGNILRSINIISDLNKKKSKVTPIGFVMNYTSLFISLSSGRLLIVNINDGKIRDIIKIANNKISRPYTNNQNMYLIKNDSIIKLN